MSLQQMRQELKRKYERLRKREEERRKAMLKYYESLAAEAPPWLPPLKREESRSNPEALEVVDKSKAEYWIELQKEVIFAPGLDRTERARRSLNLFYEAAQNLGYTEFTKFVRRWRELTEPLGEGWEIERLGSSSSQGATEQRKEWKTCPNPKCLYYKTASLTESDTCPLCGSRFEIVPEERFRRRY